MNTKYLEIIKAPLITEKSRDREAINQYSFKVSPKASKIEIKDAIERIFKVDVLEIRTLNMPVRKKRVGRYTGLTNRCKKAIVTLKPGQTIDMK